MGRARKSLPENIFEQPDFKVLMICNLSHKCKRFLPCRHQREHMYSPACMLEIPDKLSVCYGARCKEASLGR